MASIARQGGYYNLERFYGITQQQIERVQLQEVRNSEGWLIAFARANDKPCIYTIEDLKKEIGAQGNSTNDKKSKYTYFSKNLTRSIKGVYHTHYDSNFEIKQSNLLFIIVFSNEDDYDTPMQPFLDVLNKEQKFLRKFYKKQLAFKNFKTKMKENEEKSNTID